MLRIQRNCKHYYIREKIADLIIKVELEAVKIDNIYEVKEAVMAHKTEQILISLIPGSRGNHGTRIVEI